jgi:hypothetical protein
MRGILAINDIEAKENIRIDKKLSSQPYKIKAGFLDFWIPTYLYIKRQDYSLYGENGAYIPEVNIEFFELLQKHPNEYLM